MIRSVIIDDEMDKLELLKSKITLKLPDVSVIGEANSFESGKNLVNSSDFDILFLDVKLGTYTGFDLLEQVQNRNYKIIFVTAYDQYAIRAIRTSCLDYLLKPISDTELIEAIEKYRSEQKNDVSKLTTLLNNKNKVNINSITIPIGESEYEQIKTDAIIYCESSGNYTLFYLDDSRKLTVSKNLKWYEDILTNPNFFRIHDSYLVNLDKVKTFVFNDHPKVIINSFNKSDLEIEISRRKKTALKRYIKENNRFSKIPRK